MTGAPEALAAFLAAAAPPPEAEVLGPVPVPVPVTGPGRPRRAGDAPPGSPGNGRC